jgi:DNA-binding NarL/FixJ family response regulator
MSTNTGKFHPPTPASCQAITVSIVEDDDWLREDLMRKISNAEGFRCLSSYASAEMALKKLPVESPNVVIMDINLPGLNGIECVRRLKEAVPEICILMLTVYEESDLIFAALKAGANGYLLKRSIPTELLGAITYAHQGGLPMTSSVAHQIVRFFTKATASNEPVEGLTVREREILNLLVKGLAYKTIADQLSISIGTVNMFISRIYKKMHVHSRGEATAIFQKH